MNYTEIKETLKNEFFGIDDQIDEIVDSFKTWLNVKDYLNKPLITNLWGLTGVGKSALLNRIIELLNIEKKVIKIKFNSKTDSFTKELERLNSNDYIFILDEFQHLRTINGNGEEIPKNEKTDTNIIWDLLDTGKIQLYNDGYSNNDWYIFDFMYTLRTLISENVTLKDGIFYHKNLDSILLKNEMSLDDIETINSFKKYGMVNEKYNEPIDSDNNNNKNITVNKSKTEKLLYSVIQFSRKTFFDYMSNKYVEYDFETPTDIFNYLNTLNIVECYDFISNIINARNKPCIKDFSKSNIYILGNLDEAYKGLAKNLNADISADYFYHITKNINITNIKAALLKRFRSEEIARLGSKHIIYPSLKKSAFESIINKELLNFNNIINSKLNTNIEILYTKKIKNIIYKEGVFPIQGTRALFSVINDIILSKFSYIIEYYLKNNKVNNIEFDYDNKNNIILKFKFNSDILETTVFKYKIKISNLRIEKNKGRQAHRAVHEAGHAIVNCMSMKIIPEYIYSVVLGDSDSGFNIFKTDELYYDTKTTLKNKIAGYLGGYAAECIIFGDDNLSSGSSSDLEEATKIVTIRYNNCGFGNKLGYFTDKNLTSTLDYNFNNSLHADNSVGVLKEIKEALTLANNIIHEQQELLLKVAEYLTNHDKMDKKTLLKFVKKYSKNFDVNTLFTNKEEFYYDTLKSKLNELNK